ncbi:MAG: hypothetical protein KBT58_04600 [Bizionia sp.]|nr:hypothetical protein [Bizionia sp.]
MKKLVLIAIALVTFQMNAQNENAEKFNNSSVEEIAEMQTARLTKALNLDEGQQKRISIIALENAKVKKEMMASKENRKRMSKEERKTMQKRHEETTTAMDNHMKAVLSAEQYTKWSAFKAEKQEERKENRERF